MIENLELLRIAQGLVLAFGGIIVVTALRGYSRQGSTSMLFLAIGFACVTFGAVIAGLLFEMANYDLILVTTVQAMFQAFGSFVIVLSLVLTRR